MCRRHQRIGIGIVHVCSFCFNSMAVSYEIESSSRRSHGIPNRLPTISGTHPYTILPAFQAKTIKKSVPTRTLVLVAPAMRTISFFVLLPGLIVVTVNPFLDGRNDVAAFVRGHNVAVGHSVYLSSPFRGGSGFKPEWVTDPQPTVNRWRREGHRRP